MEILQGPDTTQYAQLSALELTPTLVRERRSQLRIIFDRFVRNRAAVVGLIVLGIIILLAIFAPVITHQTATYDPANTIPTGANAQRLAGPSWAHPLGTDELGRDFFARMLFGAQVSLLVGFSSMLVAMMIGVTLGCIAGFYGGWIDNVLMRIVDALLAIPYLRLSVCTLHRVLERHGPHGRHHHRGPGMACHHPYRSSAVSRPQEPGIPDGHPYSGSE